MKTLSLFLLLSFLYSSNTNAQTQEKKLRMSEGIQNALVVELPGIDKKNAEKIWKTFVKDYGKIESNRKTKELVLREVTIPAIDPNNNVDIYTKFEEFGDLTRAYFWVKQDEKFLTSADFEREIDGASVFLEDYGVQVEKDVVSVELKGQEKALKDLEKDLSKLEKRNKDLHKDIEKARDAIRKAEEEIEKNLQEQADKLMAIEEQKLKVAEVSDKMNRVGN